MSLSSDDFTALIYLKNQSRKWKNIAFATFIVVSLVFLSGLFEEVDEVNGGGDDFIASINIDGIIFDDSYRNEILRKIAKQDNIKAVIVNINSPGGGIVGSEILYNNLREIVKKKPIVTLMGSLAASGGYMASIASNHIIARNGTLTGSIGVMMQLSEVTDLADKVGIKFLNYKSSPLKGSPSPFEKSNEKADKVINDSINDSYKFFSELVIKRRKDKLNKDITNIIDGRIFTGRQAMANGLVDEIGGRKEALLYLRTQHNIDKDVEVRDVELKKPEGRLLEKVLGGMNSIGQIFGKNPSEKGLMAVWNPGHIL